MPARAARLALIALALTAPPLAAEVPGALHWIMSETAADLRITEVGPLETPEGRVIAADPLTYSADWALLEIAVPTGGGRLFVAHDVAEGRISKAVLVFADAAPVCGADVATIPVDTGLASFLTPATAKALDQAGAALADARKDLYNNWFHALFGDEHVVAGAYPLPDSPATVAIFSSGWGDGSYPVATLSDAGGAVVAVYADFMGKDDEGNWLLPDNCP